MLEHHSQVDRPGGLGGKVARLLVGGARRLILFAAAAMRPARPAGVAVLATVVVACVAAPAGASPMPAAAPAPVASLDLNRYVGTWYQLAAVPQFFNLVCARDTRAEYAALPNGDISVHNSCTTWSGAGNEIQGAARVVDPVTHAQLRVAFPGVPTQESLDGPPNYIVTALGPDYSWALVTDPYRISGFVLSRTPALDADQWSQVVAAIVAAGEQPCLYLTSPVTGGRGDITPLCRL
ncbi:lipocalin family protein [Nocardia africana]|uniref:Outer membrane lipoprotein blc n=1 Tax=Nocardia africana TaxID=134964 RepID=A0A378WNM0_9NOCA|nr:lipocalin family protein [Nocardia africana]MCC3314927.1 lipocalin family protein [Nocardia africana]SUA42789.1 Outer membrane lipoprotein blc precursor [Nocardia africana]